MSPREEPGSAARRRAVIARGVSTAGGSDATKEGALRGFTQRSEAQKATTNDGGKLSFQ